MEDTRFLIWIGIAVVWFLTKLVRRGAKKAARKQLGQPRPTVSRPTDSRTQAPPLPIESQPGFSRRGGQGPPPIVPR